MSRIKNPGIYSITNIQTGKRYIGSSVVPKERLNVHRRELNKGKHSNIHLQNSWNKYGEKSFNFEILEENINSAQLRDKENSYIIFFGIADKETNLFFEDKGYNMSWAGKEGFKDPSRQKSGKDHHLYGKPNWKKDKTFDELFGKEKSKELRDNITRTQTGRLSPKKYKHKYKWDEMSYNRQYKLWKNNDPMVPPNWLPARLKRKI